MKMFVAVLLGLACLAQADEKVAKVALDTNVVRLLKDAGAVSYSQKAPYGGGIEAIYLGYNADGKTVVGIAARETATYKKSLAIAAVVPAEGKFKVSSAEIPDVGEFHGKSQDLTREALKGIAGKLFDDAKSARGMVDAVTGATKYYQAIYVSYSAMVSKVIEELIANPAWERLPL